MRKILLTLSSALLFLSFASPARAELIPFCAYTGACQMCDFIRLAVVLADWGLGIIGGIALLFFIIGGIYLVAGGYKPDMLTKGKTIMTQAITGMLIVLSAWLIVNFVVVAFAGKDSDISKNWFAPPKCVQNPVNIKSEKNLQTCYVLYLKKQSTSTPLTDAEIKKYEEDGCTGLMKKFYDSAPCGPNQLIQWNEKNKKIECLDKCVYANKYIDKTNYRTCMNEDSCDKSTIKRGWCSGNEKNVCCQLKPTTPNK